MSLLFIINILIILIIIIVPGYSQHPVQTIFIICLFVCVK